MPYVTCEHCGLRGFVPRSWVAPPECPHCGRAVGGAPEPAPDEAIQESLELLRELLRMDIAMVSEIRSGREIARHVAGEWPGVGDLRGSSLPLEDTFCRRLLEGLIGNVVADVEHDERVADLEMARALGVKAWIGTPLRASHARLYILCCLAREARPRLGPREVRVLKGFSRSVLDQLERSDG